MRPWRDQSPWPQMPGSQRGAEWGERCHGDATQAGLAPLPLAARLSWPAQAEALRPRGRGEVGEPQRSFLCAPQGRAGCRGRAAQPPGVHCLDYLPLTERCVTERKLPVAKLDKHACPTTRQTVCDATGGCCINNIGITLLLAQLWRTFV